MKRWKSAVIMLVGAVVVLAACAGPDDRDDRDPSATANAGQAASESTATVAVVTEDGPTPTEQSAATPTVLVSPTATSTATPEPPTATPEPTPTATALPISLADSLPQADQLPVAGFFLANQGTRSALELANSYADSSAHLERLNNWGFKEHHFREYSIEQGAGDATTPYYVLTTVNEYGDGERAKDALDWLRSLNGSQGHIFVDPDPEFGDNAFASSVEAADGSPTSIAFVQIGPRIYAYFAQGGEPLEFVLELAASNTQRISEAGQPPAATGTPEATPAETTTPGEPTPEASPTP